MQAFLSRKRRSCAIPTMLDETGDETIVSVTKEELVSSPPPSAETIGGKRTVH